MTADKRKHGKILMAQAQVDEWCAEAAKTHYMQVSDAEYAAVPREARGVPHQTIPGLHAYLDDYVDALEHARTLIGVEDRRTVDSLQCLPLSPFAERQPPHCSEGSDPTVPKRFRNPDDAVGAEGRAFQVDATCADVAILREPLVPCVAITSPQDCIFGQAQPFLTSVIGAVAALAASRARPSSWPTPTRRTTRRSRRCTCSTCCSRATTAATSRKPLQDGVRTTGRRWQRCCSTPSSRAAMRWPSGHGATATPWAPPRAPRMRAQAAKGDPPIGAPLKDLVGVEDRTRGAAVVGALCAGRRST